LTTAERAAIGAEVKKLVSYRPLAEIHKAVGKTRIEMAKMLGVGQASVFKLQPASDM